MGEDGSKFFAPLPAELSFNLFPIGNVLLARREAGLFGSQIQEGSGSQNLHAQR